MANEGEETAAETAPTEPAQAEDHPSFLVVKLAHVDEARDALARLFEQQTGNEADRTAFQALVSASGEEAAIGPADEFLTSCLGRTVECEGGPFTLPAAFEQLPNGWFTEPG